MHASYMMSSLFQTPQQNQGISIWLWLLILIILIVLFVWLVYRYMRTRQEALRMEQPRMDQPRVEEPLAEDLRAKELPALESQALELQALEPQAVEPQPEALRPDMETRLPAVPLEPAAPDDLTLIEGIGPKIAQVLQDAGIRTFSDLAAASPDQLRSILEAASLRLADPGSWAEQARLAAAGDHEGLRALQDQLKGGREI